MVRKSGGLWAGVRPWIGFMMAVAAAGATGCPAWPTTEPSHGEDAGRGEGLDPASDPEAPGPSLPDGAMPDGAMPDGVMPDAAMPDGGMAGRSMPDGSVPGDGEPAGEVGGSDRPAAGATDAGVAPSPVDPTAAADAAVTPQVPPPTAAPQPPPPPAQPAPTEPLKLPETVDIPTGCEPQDLGYLGAVAHVDGQDRASFLTSRDCGWSVRVEGTDAQGTSQARDLWIFCDSPGFDLSGQPWPQSFGFPTNSAALSNPASYPAVPQLRSHAFGDGAGNPMALKTFVGADLTGVPDTEPSSTDCPAGEGYRAEWPQGAVRLPDADPGTEQVLVFYQNWCVRTNGFINFTAGTSGLALYTWRSDAPDAEPIARRLTDGWFAAGVMRNEGSDRAEPTNTYGSGAVIHAGHLYVSMCGASGNCQTARTPLLDSPTPEQLADTTRWAYLSYSGWADFPAPGPTGTCVPTFEDTCGGTYPTPYPSSIAQPSNPLTMPQAPPTVHQVADGYVMVYSPWGLGGTDSFVWRWAPWPEGPYDEPKAFSLGPHCASDRHAALNLGCRAATLHPHFRDVHGRVALSYWDYDDALGPGQGRLRLALICQP